MFYQSIALDNDVASGIVFKYGKAKERHEGQFIIFKYCHDGSIGSHGRKAKEKYAWRISALCWSLGRAWSTATY